MPEASESVSTPAESAAPAETTSPAESASTPEKPAAISYPSEGVDEQMKQSFEDLRAGKIDHQAFVDAFFARGKQLNEEASAKEAKKKAAQLEKWENEMKADAVYGGEKLKASAAAADKALEHLSPDGSLKKALSDAGLAKCPAVLRAFAKIGYSLKEDSVAGTASAFQKQKSRENFLRLMYPSAFKD